MAEKTDADRKSSRISGPIRRANKSAMMPPQPTIAASERRRQKQQRFWDIGPQIAGGEDYVTQDLTITTLADEQGQCRRFQGCLKGYTK